MYCSYKKFFSSVLYITLIVLCVKGSKAQIRVISETEILARKSTYSQPPISDDDCTKESKDLQENEVKYGKKSTELSNLDESYYDFPFNSTLTLGRGFDPNDIEQIKQSPFIFNIDTVDGTGSLNTDVDFYLVFNKEQLKKVLDVDVKVEARYLSATANVNINAAESFEFDESSLTMVLKGTCEYGRLAVKNLVLKDEAKIFLRSPTKFIEKYGRKFTVMVRRGSTVYVIITIKGISQETINKARLEVSLKASGLIASASLQSTIKSEIKNRQLKLSQNAKIISTGGNGFEGIENILSTLDSPEKWNQMKVNLSQYLQRFTFNNAAPLGYYCSNYETLGLFEIEPSNVTYAYEKLLKVVELYREYESKAHQIEEIIDPSSIYVQILPETEISKLQKKLPNIYSYLDA